MIKKNRGGLRRGAGRKPLLTVEEEIAIGAEIHNRIYAARRANKRTGNELVITPALKDLWRQLNDIPIEQRRQLARKGMLESYEGDEGLFGQWMSDVQTEIGDMKPLKIAAEGPRGVREQIIRDVAQEKSAHYGMKISERKAERCLESWRSILKKP
jgi:hypothetical protein